MRTAQDFIVEIPVLKYNDQITKARQILRDDRFREVYVVDKKEHLIGYIDITDGLRVTATKSNVTVEGFIKDAPAVHAGDSIEIGGKDDAGVSYGQRCCCQQRAPYRRGSPAVRPLPGHHLPERAAWHGGRTDVEESDFCNPGG